MSIEVQVTSRSGCALVTPHGAGEASLCAAAATVDQVADNGSVVVDLTDVILVPAAAVMRFIARLCRTQGRAGAQIICVAPRLSARRMLTRVIDAQGIAVTATVQAALLLASDRLTTDTAGSTPSERTPVCS